MHPGVLLKPGPHPPLSVMDQADTRSPAEVARRRRPARSHLVGMVARTSFLPEASDLATSQQWPNLLIIGANRSGTTSLFNELARHPTIHAGVTKETGFLTRPTDVIEQKRDVLHEYFSGANAHKYVIDGSTAYSMIPRYLDIPHKAVRLFGNEIRVIYSIREPVARLFSQLRREKLLWTTATVDEALSRSETGPHVRKYDPFFFSLYDMQIAAWEEVLPRTQIFVLLAEQWQRERAIAFANIGAFLSIDFTHATELDPIKDNTAEEIRDYPKPIRNFFKSDFYKLQLRRRLPEMLVSKGKRIFPKKDVTLTPDVRRAVEERMKPRFFESLRRLVANGYVEPTTAARLWGDEYGHIDGTHS